MKSRAKDRARLDLLRDAAIVASETFRYGRVGALVEKGRQFTRDSVVVKEHPELFVIQLPLVEFLSNERKD